MSIDGSLAHAWLHAHILHRLPFSAPPQKIKMEPQSDEESNEEFSLSGTIRAMSVARSLEIDRTHLPYRVDYGDGYGNHAIGTVCKMCMKNFDTGKVNHNQI